MSSTLHLQALRGVELRTLARIQPAYGCRPLPPNLICHPYCITQALRGVELRTPDCTHPPGVWQERKEAKRIAVVRELALEELTYSGKK